MRSKLVRAASSFLNILREESSRDRLSEAYPSWEEAAEVAIGYKTNIEIYGAQAERIRRGQEGAPIDVAALIAALALRSPARVLDYGGGTAVAYLQLLRTAPDLIAR